MKASWSRLDDGSWGVRVDNTRPSEDLQHLAGREIEVTKRDGSSQMIVMGAMVSTWNGGRAAQYRVPPRKRKGQEEQPKRTPSGKTFIVRLSVEDPELGTVTWELPIESSDALLPDESSPSVARCAINVRDIVSHGAVTAEKPKKPARPSGSRKPAAKKPTTRKAA